MKRLASLGLGVLAAVGGFVDFGGIVTSTQAGAQFRFALIWTLIIGVIGFSVFAEMSARVTISTSRTMYDVIRDRLGARLALIPLLSTTISQILTVFVELAGMALVIEYASGLSYLIWIPAMALILLSIIWFVGFEMLDNSTALVGLTMLVVLVVMVKGLHDWGGMAISLVHPSMSTASPIALYLFSVVSLLGAYMTPYQFAFYSSGALEEEWGGHDFTTNRIVSVVGTTFGGAVTLGITVIAAIYLYPTKNVSSFVTLLQPVKDSLGQTGLIFLLIGIFAVCVGAGLEAAMSGSYSIMQYFGWDWGKKGKPHTAPVFHFGVMCLLALAVIVAETQVNPIQMTTVTMAVGAVTLPFNFIPLMIVANDRDFLGEQKNNVLTNIVALLLIGLLCVVTVAAIPLLFLSGTL